MLSNLTGLGINTGEKPQTLDGLGTSHPPQGSCHPQTHAHTEAGGEKKDAGTGRDVGKAERSLERQQARQTLGLIMAITPGFKNQSIKRAMAKGGEAGRPWLVVERQER